MGFFEENIGTISLICLTFLLALMIVANHVNKQINDKFCDLYEKMNMEPDLKKKKKKKKKKKNETA